MTKYLWDIPFTVAPGASQAYRDGWEATFGKKDAPTPAQGGPCPCESGLTFAECHGKAEDGPADV